MKRWFKDVIHNVIVHSMLPFLPSDMGTKLHDLNATWAFGLNRYNEIALEKAHGNGGDALDNLRCDIRELLSQPQPEQESFFHYECTEIADVFDVFRTGSYARIMTVQGKHNLKLVLQLLDSSPTLGLQMLDVYPLYTTPPKREPLSDRLTANMFNANKKATYAACYWAGVSDAEKAHGITGDKI